MKQVPSTMSGVVVTIAKALPVVVRPSELELGTPPPSDTIALSPFDRLVPPIPVSSLFVFDRTIDEPVETIKRALSRALAHYRPVAGRLAGDGSIACTDEGVTFVAASASCSLEEATAALQHMDLTVLYPGLLCRDADPLLLLQVTEFACGGFVVGVSSNHVIADGAGTVQFLQAVAELARGISPPSCLPIRSWDDSLPVPTASTVAAQKSAIKHEPPRLAHLDIVVPSSLISCIKAGGLGSYGEHCTALDAVMAVLWRCRTRAAMSASEDEAPAPLKFVCSMRAYVGAPSGYYGNCIRAQVVPATAGAVANSCIGDLVRLIRRAKEKIPDLLSTGGGGGDGDGRGVADAADHQAQAPLWYEAFSVTDWRYLGLDAADFGGGAPARVLWHAKRIMEPGCVVCPPRRAGRDGGVDVSSVFVKPEHVDTFLGELARLAASAE
ncbi:10-deacetylbaccatin III 10-O-acetyltransferase-like [Panicum miliaceum]|uniref:10-deacetylbaccatin III 10-O-acetyltransferase-like n=1 Tax=Panicum miliaceum TaxID=4540 RepID=A0A3L6PZW5_PANMI|nr:10-deacetylbaccatin III 10-O-acetyltransferase-like [Panicum miliaceum]